MQQQREKFIEWKEKTEVGLIVRALARLQGRGGRGENQQLQRVTGTVREIGVRLKLRVKCLCHVQYKFTTTGLGYNKA